MAVNILADDLPQRHNRKWDGFACSLRTRVRHNVAVVPIQIPELFQLHNLDVRIGETHADTTGQFLTWWNTARCRGRCPRQVARYGAAADSSAANQPQEKIPSG